MTRLGSAPPSVITIIVWTSTSILKKGWVEKGPHNHIGRTLPPPSKSFLSFHSRPILVPPFHPAKPVYLDPEKNQSGGVDGCSFHEVLKNDSRRFRRGASPEKPIVGEEEFLKNGQT